MHRADQTGGTAVVGQLVDLHGSGAAGKGRHVRHGDGRRVGTGGDGAHAARPTVQRNGRSGGGGIGLDVAGAATGTRLTSISSV